MPNFNWTNHAFNVLESGTNMTYKYESDGTAREMDTMAAYFLSDEERYQTIIWKDFLLNILIPVNSGIFLINHLL